AIYHATHRDAYSGGSANIFHVKESGWVFIGSYDVDKLHWEYKMQDKTQDKAIVAKRGTNHHRHMLA
ncbi:20S proteasome component beta 5, partial [Haplosporangium sp. Z 11]